MNFNWKVLQNGSDIRGVAVEGVKGEDVNLTFDIVKRLANSFVEWLKQNNIANTPVIAVGTDSRISGKELKNAFISGIIEMGYTAIDCNMASTPAMFMSTQLPETDANAGVMITASHLPYNRNGLKFFTKKGGLDKADISSILNIAENHNFKYNNNKGQQKTFNLIDTYSNWLVKQIQTKTGEEKPLKKFKIIVDAGNGAGGFFAEKVLQRLGANTLGSQFLEPDGYFPNHVPNPENKEAMESICKAVTNNKADLGIIFDTDVDRSAIVDNNGNPINRNDLVAVASAIILKEHPSSTIVTDSITSKGLTEFIEKELNGIHHRFKRGYKNVINEAIQLNNKGAEAWLAIETSGHAALKENYFLDDGAFLAAKILIEIANLKKNNKTISDLIKNLKRPKESKEFRIKITANDFKNYGNTIIEELTKFSNEQNNWKIVTPNYEGIRVNCNADNEKGWFLLRLSLHDPVLPLNIESDIDNGVENIAQKLIAFFNQFKDIKLPDRL